MMVRSSHSQLELQGSFVFPADDLIFRGEVVIKSQKNGYQQEQRCDLVFRRFLTKLIEYKSLSVICYSSRDSFSTKREITVIFLQNSPIIYQLQFKEGKISPLCQISPQGLTDVVYKNLLSSISPYVNWKKSTRQALVFHCPKEFSFWLKVNMKEVLKEDNLRIFELFCQVIKDWRSFSITCGDTLLHQIARFNSHRCLQFLWQKKRDELLASLDRLDNPGFTALHRAACFGSAEVAERLLYCGADYTLRVKIGRERKAAYDLALDQTKTLLKDAEFGLFSVDPEIERKKSLVIMSRRIRGLFFSAMAGYAMGAAALVKKYKVSPNIAYGLSLDTPLLLLLKAEATQEGHLIIFLEAAQSKIDINHVNSDGERALTLALKRGFEKFNTEVYRLFYSQLQFDATNTPFLHSPRPKYPDQKKEEVDIEALERSCSPALLKQDK